MLPYNVPCHFEFVTDSFDKWESFYSKLFGWKLLRDGKIYSHIDFGATSPITGGVLNIDRDPHNEIHYPIIYIKVRSAKDILEMAIRLGAVKMEDVKSIEKKGQSASFCDKDGNLVFLWEDK